MSSSKNKMYPFDCDIYKMIEYNVVYDTFKIILSHRVFHVLMWVRFEIYHKQT